MGFNNVTQQAQRSQVNCTVRIETSSQSQDAKREKRAAKIDFDKCAESNSRNQDNTAHVTNKKQGGQSAHQHQNDEPGLVHFVGQVDLESCHGC